MKQNIRIGVVCFARKTFDFNAALKIFQKIQDDLKKIEDVSWEIIENLVIEVEDAKKSANLLVSKEIDGIIFISGTFHLGFLAIEMSKIIKKPILLWGLNELPYDGGKIRLNSVCGIWIKS